MDRGSSPTGLEQTAVRGRIVLLLNDLLCSQFQPLQILELFLRVLIAGLFGAAIGFERTRRFKEAGIRTHVIVCAAAALMMVISKYAFFDVTAADGVRGADPARVAAQVVSGISFLCAGVIFKNGSTVKGLTTAAGIWATAGIGLAVGAGMYVIGIFTTAVVAAIQILMHKFTIGVDSMVVGRMHCVVSNSAEFRKALNEYVDEHGMQILEVKIDMMEDGSAAYDLTLRMRHDVTVNDLSEFLESVGDVRGVSFELGV